jgi:hypothetical protein
LADSIREFGFVNPILLRADDTVCDHLGKKPGTPPRFSKAEWDRWQPNPK